MEYRQNGTNTALSSFIDADFAGMYSVSSQDATGIAPIGAIKIAQESGSTGILKQGDYGFLSDYGYI